jgi:restriction system protein
MARKKKKQISLAVILTAALCIYLLFQLITENLAFAISVLIVVGIVVAFGVVLPARRNRRGLLEKAGALIEQNSDQLAKRRAQLVRHDPYGKVLLEKWHAEIDYFITEHIRPRLTIPQQSILERERVEIARMIMLRAEQAQQAPVFKAFSETMTPTEFEAFCAEELRQGGWSARLTPTTGDQGVDVIAEKNGIRVVLQCKLYSGSVGNSAIQEVVAGKAYERAHHCAVVTNSRYTPAAEQLAGTNGVLLLHFSELPNLETLLQRRFPESMAHAYTPNLFANAPFEDLQTIAPEPVQNENTERPEVPVSTEEPHVGNKRLLIVGGIAAAIIIVIATVLLSRDKGQKAVIIDNRLTTVSLPRKRLIPPDFTTYTNASYGFRISYPKSFVVKSVAEDGNGMSLVSSDGAATLDVAGGNTNGYSLEDIHDASVAGATGELGYQQMGGTWFVITWKDGDRLFYQKVFAGRGSKNWFTFTFPEDQRSAYEPIVTGIEKSFRPGDLDRVR